MVSIKEVSLTLESLCLLELADYQELVTLPWWMGKWTTPCSRKVAFNLQPCGELPGPACPMQIQEMGSHHILWCVWMCSSGRLGSDEEPTSSPGKVGAVTEQRAGMGNTLEICLFLLSSSHSVSLCFVLQSPGKIGRGKKADKTSP